MTPRRPNSHRNCRILDGDRGKGAGQRVGVAVPGHPRTSRQSPNREPPAQQPRQERLGRRPTPTNFIFPAGDHGGPPDTPLEKCPLGPVNLTFMAPVLQSRHRRGSVARTERPATEARSWCVRFRTDRPESGQSTGGQPERQPAYRVEIMTYQGFSSLDSNVT